MVVRIRIFEDSVILRLDTETKSLFSNDADGSLATTILDMVQNEGSFFGIQGALQNSGSDILSDPWSFFLWLDRRQFSPNWVGTPPKVPKAPKGSVV
jgi:hypothetical protein